jgi:hypothetical protein
MFEKTKKHAEEWIELAAQYNKERWDKSHREPEFKIGDKVLVSIVNFNNLAGPRKMRNSFAGPFVIKALHGKNAVEVILTEEFSRKHPTFPVSLIKHYHPSDKDKFPERNTPTNTPTPVEEDTSPGIIQKVLREKRVKKDGKETKLYLVRYKNKEADSDQWFPETEIKESQTLLRKSEFPKDKPKNRQNQ